MSTPVTMSRPAESGGADGCQDLAAYVAAVRAQLDDLGADEIEELTGGLEADLADELRQDDGPPVRKFGEPAAYAAELRSAAGLAPRPVPAQASNGPAALKLGLRAAGQRFGAPLFRQPGWPDLRDFLISLRSAWWLLRGFVAYQLADQMLTHMRQFFPYSGPTWVALIVLVIGSVELGRRGWAGNRNGRRLLVAAANTCAVGLVAFVLPFIVAGSYLNPVPQHSQSAASSSPPKGLYNGTHQVVNVFPYDKDGNPLTDVQLFDDRGRPIAVGKPKYTGRNDERVRLVPPMTADGRPGFYVFPLRETVTRAAVDPRTGKTGTRPAGGALRAAVRPDPTQAAVVPPLLPAASAAPVASGVPVASEVPVAPATPAP
jgi:hypothetical protein